MALELSRQNDQGHTANYWKIEGIRCNYSNKQSALRIALYKDAASSTTVAPTEVISVNWRGGDFPFDDVDVELLGENQRKIAYTKLKTLNDVNGIDFTSALDV